MRGLAPIAWYNDEAATRGVASRWVERKGPVKSLDRITLDPAVMGGKACIRGMRVTAGMVVGLLAEGCSPAEILQAYPYLEREDIEQSLAYAAWRLEEHEASLSTP